MIRLLDIALALVAVLLLSPLLVAVTVVLRMTGEGEVLFWQERIGRYGHPFQILKFATMLRDSPNIGSGTITLSDDSRVLPVGRVLRATKINELPQLFNIIVGDMTFVGPRPHVARELRGVPAQDLERIYALAPGLTGIASIVFRDEEKILQSCSNPRVFYDEVIAPYKSSLEIWAAERMNIRLYIAMVFLTGVSVFIPKTNGWLYRIYPNLPELPPELRRVI